jgi:hypothetical protein
LVDVNTPVDADGTTTGTPAGTGLTSTPLINLGQGSTGLVGSTSGTGPLVDVNTPVDADGTTTGTPAGTGLTSTPLINLGQGSTGLVGSTSGTGTLVTVNTPVNASTNGSTATPAGSSLPLMNLG